MTAALPLWIFDAKRRVPGTRVGDYLSLVRLLWPGSGKTVGETIAGKGPLYARLIEPFLLAALNIDPPDGSAKLAAAVIRETLAAGGRACRPLIARDGLAATLIEPALDYLRERGALIKLEHQLRAMRFGAQCVEALDFGSEIVALADGDAVILAVPPYAAASLVQGLSVPNEFRAIVNAHFRIDPPAGQPPILGVLNATTQWIFAFPGPAVGDGQCRRPLARYAARAIGADHLGGSGGGDRAAGCVAGCITALADRARAPRYFRRNPGAGSKPPGHADGLAQSLARRRLDKYRLARDHRRCDSLGQPRRRTPRRQYAVDDGAKDSANDSAMTSETRSRFPYRCRDAGAARAAAGRWAFSVRA